MSDDISKVRRERVAWCLKERDEAIAMLERIEAQGIRTWSQSPGGAMQETTSERVKFLKNIIAAMEALLAETRHSPRIQIRTLPTCAAQRRIQSLRAYLFKAQPAKSYYRR